MKEKEDRKKEKEKRKPEHFVLIKLMTSKR